MPTIRELSVGLGLDHSKLDQGLNQSQQKINGFANNVSGSLETAFGFVIGDVIVKGFQAIGNAVENLASKMIAGNQAFEVYNAQFTVLLGNADLAKNRMAELAEFGATTPFDLPGVVEADRVLQSFGLHAADTANRFGRSGEEIRRITGDMAAGVGISMQEMANHLGRFSAGATGEAIQRFQELGVITRQELAALGVEFSKSGELVSPLNEAMTVLLEAMDAKFGGMMDVQSGTLDGMLSNFRDWIDNSLRVLGEPIFDQLKEGLGNLLELLQPGGNVNNAIVNLAELFRQIIALAGELASAVFGDVFGGIDSFMGTLADKIKQASDFVRQLRDEIKGLSAGDILSELGPGLADLDAKMNDSLDKLEARHNQTVQGIQNQLTQAGEKLGAGMAEIAEKYGRQIEQIQERAQKAIDRLNDQIARKREDFNEKLGDLDKKRAKTQKDTEREIARNSQKLEERLTDLKKEHMRRRSELVGQLMTAESEEAFLRIQNQIKSEDQKFQDDVDKEKRATDNQNAELKRRQAEQEEALNEQEEKLRKHHQRDLDDLKKKIAEEVAERDKALAEVNEKRAEEEAKLQAQYQKEVAALQAKLAAENAAYAEQQQQIRDSYAEQAAALEEDIRARAAAVGQGTAATLGQFIRDALAFLEELKIAWQEGGILGVLDLIKTKMLELADDMELQAKWQEWGQRLGESITTGAMTFISEFDWLSLISNPLTNIEAAAVELYLSFGQRIFSGFITGIIEAITGEEVSEQLTASLGMLWEVVMQTVISAFFPAIAAKFALDAWTEFKAAVSGMSWAEIGQALAQGIIEGVTAGLGALGAAVNGAINSAKNSVKADWFVRSPSKRMAKELGGPLGAGVVSGFADELANLGAKASKMLALPQTNFNNRIGNVTLQQTNYLPAGTDSGLVDTIMKKTEQLVNNQMYKVFEAGQSG